MQWYDHLIVGPEAARRRYAILQGIRRGKPGKGVHVLVPSETSRHILDILPAEELTKPYYAARENLMIFGVAADYDEAVELAASVVHTLYRKTGTTDLRLLLGDTENGL